MNCFIGLSSGKLYQALGTTLNNVDQSSVLTMGLECRRAFDQLSYYLVFRLFSLNFPFIIALSPIIIIKFGINIRTRKFRHKPLLNVLGTSVVQEAIKLYQGCWFVRLLQQCGYQVVMKL